jgi:peptidoglycan/LPS O-acetylase OafA/YrhL
MLQFLKMQYLAFMICAVGFALLLSVLLDRWPNRLRVANTLRISGNCSYSIYAFHVPILVLMNSIVFHGNQVESIYWSFLLVATTVACCCGFYFLAERPSISVLRRMARPPRSATTASAEEATPESAESGTATW